MEYIISNLTPKEIRVSTKEIDGRLIYKGHKLGVPDGLLPIIILHHHEKYSSSFIFMDYIIWKERYNLSKITPSMNDCWIKHTDNKRALMESYDTLLKLMESHFGKFKNIYIVEF